MKKYLTVLALLGFQLIVLHAQTPNIQWEQSYGSSGFDFSNAMTKTRDGGYALVGGTTSTNGEVSGNHGGLDIWVVKISDTGAILWQKCYGGSQSDQGNSIIQTIDGGYIIAGFSYSNDGDVTNHHGDSTTDDVWIVKIDSTGAIQWQKSMGGSQIDEGWSIIQTADSGYMIAGESFSDDGDLANHYGDSTTCDYWVIKLSNSGTIQWQKNLGGDQSDQGINIVATFEGNYVVNGYSSSNDIDVSGHHGDSTTADFWTVEIDDTGAILWEKSLGGSQLENTFNVLQTKDSGFVMTGVTESNDGDVTSLYGTTGGEDIWVVKLNSTGNIQWEKTYGGTATDVGLDIIQTFDGGYALLGETYSDDGQVTGHFGDTTSIDEWLVKLSDSGAIQWEMSLGGSGMDFPGSSPNPGCLVQTSDGGYAIGGYSNSTDGDVTGNHGDFDVWFVKLQFPCPVIADSTIISANICQGQSYNGHMATGIYRDTLTSVNSCDSIIILNLTVNPVHCDTLTHSICQGDTFTFGSMHLTSPGTYSDTLIASWGCDSIVILNLTVNPLPVVDFSWDTLIAVHYLAGGAQSAIWCPIIFPRYLIPLAGGMPGGGTYSGNLVQNDTLNLQTFLFNTETYVFYRYTDSLGCMASAEDSVFYTICEGVSDISYINSIHLYPNPNRGSFTLQTANSIGSSYTISDMLGSVVAQRTISSDSQAIDLPEAGEGVYTLVVKGSPPLRFVIVR